MLDRRTLLKTSLQLTLLAPLARMTNAATPSDARLVLVILRGALDGLAAVAPYGEPRYQALRGPLALGAPGTEGGVLKLDGTFGLHPALTNLHALYATNELTVLHAIATPYRERSHFDAQKVLEAGKLTPAATDGGWLNRALAVMRGAGDARGAVALSDTVPLVLRGEVAINTWAPSRLPDADEDLLARVRRMYEAVDPLLAAKLNEALDARAIAGDAAAGATGGGPAQQVTPLVGAAARFLKSESGPRIAVLDVGGWDTHANQGGAQGNLALRLRGLDAGIKTLKDELRTVWGDTTVLVVTEFGRTVAVNGTRGTDHGTAGIALLAGGNVGGGRIVADWPGLNARDLYEGRDLKPTTDLRSIFKGVLAERFGLAESTLERAVFPDSAAAAPTRHLTA